MRGGFTKGLIIGGIVGASVSMIRNGEMMRPGTRRRIVRAGRTILRRRGGIIGDIVDILR